MPNQPMRGVFPILVTPFDEDSQIDEDSLRSLVEFNLAAGVHGLGVALGSEIFKLSEAERERVTRIVVEQVGGRVPVVINSGAAGTDLAVFYSQAAERCGADALMVMPPAFMPAGPQEVLEYYRAISEAVGIPIFIQDTSSAPVPPSLARQIAEECQRVGYVKVEKTPILESVAETIFAAGNKLVVFGGAGGTYFLEELRLGSQGSMPFCSQPEAFVEVWNRAQRGEAEAARLAFEQKILPVNTLADRGAGVYYAVHKEILRRRGVIRTAKVRGPAPAVDDAIRRELDGLIERLYP